jgi:O-acetyl-ADP-ribose deacetylase (regulator of RNase III)
MIEKTGDLLDVRRGIIVQGCNAQGVMGSGVAKAIRDKYPFVYDLYRGAYEKKGLQLGQVVWATVSKEEPMLTIANAITQEFYGRDPNRVYVSYEGLRIAFERVAEIARKHDLPVHYPRIGAGLAQGDWNRITAIIDTALTGVEHTLWVPQWERQPSPPRRVSRPG